jgi:hypothetical protein
MNTQTKIWHEEPPNSQCDSGLMQKLPALLRLLGAAALLIAMYSFLTKGWQNGNDLFRYLLMLGHTAALAVIGLASGHWLKESKGARLLLTLALASVPANFAILGAFIFSQTAAVDAYQYPHYVAWSVDTLQTALFTSGAAMLLLVPLTLLGFTVLARSISKKLFLLFLLSNTVLLLPLRDPQLVGLLTLALTGCILYFSRKVAHGYAAAKTGEGVTALAMQLLPLAVLTVRSLWLYSIDFFLLSAMSITLFLVLRQISLYLEQDSNVRGFMDVLSFVPATATGIWFGAMLHDSSLIPAALVLPSAGFVTATLIYDIAQRNWRHGDMYRRIAVACLLFSSILNLINFDNLFAAMACIVTGLMSLFRGYKMQQRSLFSGGIILILTGTAHQFYQLVLHFDLGSWATLAILGITAIVIASVMESQGGKFKPLLNSWKEKLQGWEL